MSFTLHAPLARRGALAIAGTALLAGSATPATHATTVGDQTAGAHTRTTIGDLPSSPGLGIYPTIDALGNSVVAVAGPKGLSDTQKLTASSGELWFSRLDDSPTKLAVAGIPSWADPHLGTDAGGRTVAIYPRCTAGLASDCDLYAWDVEANTERKLTEVDADGVGEVEGTIDHGAIAWTTVDSSELQAPAAYAPGLLRRLMLRSAAGTTVTLSKRGGTNLALRGGVVAQRVLATADGEHSRVELVRLGRKRRGVVTYSAGAAGHWAVGLRFFGDELRFGLASQDETSLYRVSVSHPKQVRKVRTPYPFTSLAFARRDLVVWIGESTSDESSPLLSDFVPKRFG